MIANMNDKADQDVKRRTMEQEQLCLDKKNMRMEEEKERLSHQEEWKKAIDLIRGRAGMETPMGGDEGGQSKSRAGVETAVGGGSVGEQSKGRAGVGGE